MGQKQPRTTNEGEKIKSNAAQKTKNASKPMLLLIFDMPKTVIKGKKNPVHNHFLY